MIIICPECSTKFRVDPARIPDGGTKVRCARCKHVFPAEKPPAETAADPAIAEPASRPAQTKPEPPAAPEETVPGEEQSPVSAPIEGNHEATDADENSFSYDQFRELDSSDADVDNFTFGDDKGAEEPSAADQASTTEAADDDAFSFSVSTDETTTTVPDEATESAADKQQPTVTTEDTSTTEKESTVATEPPATAVTEKKNSAATSIGRIFLLLILGLTIIGGALYFINGPEQIEQVIQQIIGQQTSQHPQSNQIALTNLEGKFINNQEAGELFVIRGKATNNFKEPRASIQVKGVIFDQNGKPLLQKTIFCGNPISDQELQTLPFNKLEEMMGNQFGKAQTNMKINSEQAIPFVIAFRDLPKSLSEFSVNVTSSKPVAQ